MRQNFFPDNHARGAVPSGEHVSGLAIGVVLIGMTLTLPMFILTGEVMSGLGAAAGAGAVVLAGGLVAVTATLTGLVGVRTRLSTYSILAAPFGRLGARCLTALFSVVAVGWFGVTVGFFGAALDLAVQDVVGADLPFWLHALGGGAFMTGTVLFGFRGIAALNRVAAPLRALVLVWAGVWVLEQMPLEDFIELRGRADGAFSDFGAAVSALLGAVFAAAAAMPDLARFARRGRDVCIAAFVSFASVSAALSILAGAPSLITGDPDFMANLIAIGLGAPAAAALILATWTTNVINLYAASLSLGRLVRLRRDWVLTLLAGAAGTALALAGVTTAFIPLLMVVGALIPPVAGVYVVHFLMRGAGDARAGDEAAQGAAQRAFRFSAFAAWAAGSAVALAATYVTPSMTGAPAIDGLTISMAVYAALDRAAPAVSKAVSKAVAGKRHSL